MFTPHGYYWTWLRDNRSLVQQTESTSHSGVVDGDDHVARLELVSIVEQRVEVRTLHEAPIQQQSVAFAWSEQP